MYIVIIYVLWGQRGGLGREIVYQGLKNKNFKVLALTGENKAIYEPFRGNGFNDIVDTPPIIDPKLKIDNYWKNITDDYENIIFCTGCGKFSNINNKKYLSNVSYLFFEYN